jgi:Ca2+-transporting ATPase
MKGNLVTVVRDEKLVNVDELTLCEGDLVVLQAGDMVPADLKLVEARGLEVDEFEITGEIMPVAKKADDDTLYMGSRVTRGAGKGIVVATGGRTEYGQVLKQEWEVNRPEPFKLFKKNYLGTVGLLLPVFVIHLTRSNHVLGVLAFYLLYSVFLILLQNDELFQSILVSAELGNLGRAHIQIRDAGTMKRFGQIDLLCFDKTGVLTTRHMEVKRVYFADKTIEVPAGMRDELEASFFRLVINVYVLCNDVQFYEKVDLANPVDKALISAAVENGVDPKELLSRYRRVYDLPFDPENRYMACGFEWEDQEVRYFVKGDPEVVLGMCSHYVTAAGSLHKIDFEFRRNCRLNAEAISQNGSTAIALAFQAGNPGVPPKAYTFLCLVQLENPLQLGARGIITGIREKGIRSIMLTGDRTKTAIRVSEECGITQDSQACLTGKMIDGMELSEVARQAGYCSVYARLKPSQKGVLIRLFQQKGYSVAMVGDGPNDGIALKVADVGISFHENSSPIARRLSKILINDLADFLSLIDGSKRIKRRTGHIKLFRIFIITVSLLGNYLWILTPNIINR